jgi:FkbM family methyltransferase
MAMPTPQFFATLHCLLPVNGGARENWPRAGLEAFAACGPEGRVVACEPNPLLAGTYLPQNLALNGFHHGVEICPKVVGNLDDQSVDFVLHDGDFATSSLERWAYAHRCGTVRAPAITLDRLCTDWPRLDLVKIDAEGAEALVWGGCKRHCVASRTRPSSWSCTSSATRRRRSACCTRSNAPDIRSGRSITRAKSFQSRRTRSWLSRRSTGRSGCGSELAGMFFDS